MISMRQPKSQARYYAVRQACVRSLSCEVLPGRAGPMLFGDANMGYAISYVFQLADPAARGGRRWYALLSIFDQESIAVALWEFITVRFEVIANQIKTATAIQRHAKSDPKQTSNADGVKHFEGFLRRRERGSASKGLAELTDMQDIFIELHATFAWMLDVMLYRT